MEGSSPARLYCLLVGGVLVIAGIIGFFYEASFAVGNEVVADDVFGILAVNGWHNLVHIAIGGLLLVAAGGAARPAALFVGVLYLVLAGLGFIATGGDGITFVAENGVLAARDPRRHRRHRRPGVGQGRGSGDHLTSAYTASWARPLRRARRLAAS